MEERSQIRLCGIEDVHITRAGWKGPPLARSGNPFDLQAKIIKYVGEGIFAVERGTSGYSVLWISLKGNKTANTPKHSHLGPPKQVKTTPELFSSILDAISGTLYRKDVSLHSRIDISIQEDNSIALNLSIDHITSKHIPFLSPTFHNNLFTSETSLFLLHRPQTRLTHLNPSLTSPHEVLDVLGIMKDSHASNLFKTYKTVPSTVSIPPLIYLRPSIRKLRKRKRSFYFPMPSRTILRERLKSSSKLSKSTVSPSEVDIPSGGIVDEELSNEEDGETQLEIIEKDSHSLTFQEHMVMVQNFARDVYSFMYIVGNPHYKYSQLISDGSYHSLEKEKKIFCNTSIQSIEASLDLSDLQLSQLDSSALTTVQETKVVAGFDGTLRKFPMTSINYWDKASLEPFRGSTKVRYLVLTLWQDDPTSSLLVERFFSDLDGFFRIHHLGMHVPFLEDFSLVSGETACLLLSSLKEIILSAQNMEHETSSLSNSKIVLYFVVKQFSWSVWNIMQFVNKVNRFFSIYTGNNPVQSSVQFKIIPFTQLLCDPSAIPINKPALIKQLCFSVYRQSSRVDPESSDSFSNTISQFRPLVSISVDYSSQMHPIPSSVTDQSGPAVSCVYMNYRVIPVHRLDMKFSEKRYPPICAFIVAAAVDANGEHLNTAVIELREAEAEDEMVRRIWDATMSKILEEWRKTVDEFNLYAVVGKLGMFSLSEQNAWNDFICNQLSHGEWGGVGSGIWEYEDDFSCLLSISLVSIPDTISVSFIGTSGPKVIVEHLQCVSGEYTRGILFHSKCHGITGKVIEEHHLQVDLLHLYCGEPSSIDQRKETLTCILLQLNHLRALEIDSALSNHLYPYHFVLIDRICDILNTFQL